MSFEGNPGTPALDVERAVSHGSYPVRSSNDAQKTEQRRGDVPDALAVFRQVLQDP